jgi:hypothetical protein
MEKRPEFVPDQRIVVPEGGRQWRHPPLRTGGPMSFEADTPLSDDARLLLARLAHRLDPRPGFEGELVLGGRGARIPVWDDDPE